MQVKNRIFPYPVLNHNRNLSNYLDLNFDLEYEESIEEDYYILKNAHFYTDSKIVNDLYNAKKIDVVCVIECSYTIIRRAYKLDRDKSIDIKLAKNDFRDKVYISMFACANDDFEIESNEFDDDYSGIKHKIEKYDIVAANDGYYVYFKHQDLEENFAKSIFSIIIDHNIKDGTYNVDYSSNNKIVISLSDNDYQNYKTIYAVPNYKEVFFNMLLIPTLTEALTKCMAIIDGNDYLDIDEVSNRYLWFNSITDAYFRLNGTELTKEEFVKMSPVTFAQHLLGKPLGASLINLIDEMNKIQTGGYSNE